MSLLEVTVVALIAGSVVGLVLVYKNQIQAEKKAKKKIIDAYCSGEKGIGGVAQQALHYSECNSEECYKPEKKLSEQSYQVLGQMLKNTALRVHEATAEEVLQEEDFVVTSDEANVVKEVLATAPKEDTFPVSKIDPNAERAESIANYIKAVSKKNIKKKSKKKPAKKAKKAVRTAVKKVNRG